MAWGRTCAWGLPCLDAATNGLLANRTADPVTPTPHPTLRPGHAPSSTEQVPAAKLLLVWRRLYRGGPLPERARRHATVASKTTSSRNKGVATDTGSGRRPPGSAASGCSQASSAEWDAMALRLQVVRWDADSTGSGSGGRGGTAWGSAWAP